MEYRILYLEDQKADSLINDFKEHDIEVVVNKASRVEEAIKAMTSARYDAYLMDYRLSEGKGSFNAPAFAGYLRTEDKKGRSIQAPIIMITNETGLHIVNDEQNKQDMFDLIIRKEEYSKSAKDSINMVIAYIEAYKTILESDMRLEDVLQLTKNETKDYIDSRLQKEMTNSKEEKNVFRYLKLISEYLLASPGLLIDDRYLAARLGVDKKTSGDEWIKLMEVLENYRYRGVLSSAVNRWWMPKLKYWWATINPKEPLRMKDASERVDILNKKFNLHLKEAKTIKHCDSSTFWAVCRALNRPIDPAEGYVCNSRYKMPWEENEYISLLGALEHPEYQKMLSESDKREVRDYGKGKC